MSFHLSAGIVKKVGLPGYSSYAASCSIECELDGVATQVDDALQDRVTTVFAACQQAVEAQLARHAVPPESRQSLNDIRPEPHRWTQELIDHLPYALRWLQRCRQVVARPLGREMWSRQRTHRVELGRPWLSKLITIFTYQPRVRRQCLIPYFRRAGPNELLVFERGPNWSARQPPRGV